MNHRVVLATEEPIYCKDTKPAFVHCSDGHSVCKITLPNKIIAPWFRIPRYLNPPQAIVRLAKKLIDLAEKDNVKPDSLTVTVKPVQPGDTVICVSMGIWTDDPERPSTKIDENTPSVESLEGIGALAYQIATNQVWEEPQAK